MKLDAEQSLETPQNMKQQIITKGQPLQQQKAYASADIRSRSRQAKKGWKKQSLVGKMWEIYWDPHNCSQSSKHHPTSDHSSDHSSSSSSSNSSHYPDSSHSSSASEQSESEYDADWYDAHVKSYSPESDIFEVSFVGEEKTWRMDLKPQFVRPIESPSYSSDASAAMPLSMLEEEEEEEEEKEGPAVVEVMQHEEYDVDRNWANGVTQKDWEIYWEPSTSDDCKDHNSDDDHESFHSDWYEATIQSYNPTTNLFEISFLGEDKRYEMALTTESSGIKVRPSIRAWVRRTKYLLDLSKDQVMEEDGINTKDMKSIMDLLPHATESFKVDSSSASSAWFGICVDKKQFDMECYVRLLNDQLESIELLTFASSSTYELSEEPISAKRNGIMVENSKEHVDYLASRMQLMMESCSWWRSTKALIHMHGLNENDSKMARASPLVEIQDLHSRAFNGTVLFIQTLLLDSNRRPNNKKGAKRTRPLSQLPKKNVSTFTGSRESLSSSLKSKRGKKRRMTNTRRAQWAALTGEDSKDSDSDYLMNHVRNCENSYTDITSWNEILRNLNIQFDMYTHGQHLMSSELIGKILQRYASNIGGRSFRYLTSELVDCLVFFLNRGWKCIMDLVDEVKLALGFVYAKEFEHHGAQALFQTQNAYVDIDEEGEAENAIRGKGCSLDDISSCLKRCREDPLLNWMNLSEIIFFLEKKVVAIMTFHKKVWERIGSGICQPLSSPLQLHTELCHDVITGDDPVVIELSKMQDDPACLQTAVSTIATKRNIEEAIKLRKWFIIAQWILKSGHRERFQTLAKCYEQRHIIACMDQLPIEYSPLYDSKQVAMITSQLRDRYTKMRRFTDETLEGAVCESSCQELLKHFSKNYPNISILEEQCAILADMFAWNARAKKSLSVPGKVDFNLISTLHKTLQDMRRGVCPARSKITAFLLRDLDSDESIHSFVKEQITLHCAEMELLVSDLHSRGCAWYRKASHVVRSLKHYGNASVNITTPSNVSSKVSNFIELKVIKELVAEYDQSAFEFPHLDENLLNAGHDASKWVEACLSLIPSNYGCSDPSSVLQDLRHKCQSRPKGILMFPSRQLVGEWIELLHWYSQCSQTFDLLRNYYLQKSSHPGTINDTNSAIDIVQINHEIQKLTSQGYELIQSSVSQLNFHIDLKLMGNEGCLNEFKCTTPISLSKINSCAHSLNLLRSILIDDDQLGAKGVFFTLKLFVWRHLSSDFLGKLEKSSRRRGKYRPTLESAKALLQSLDHLPESFDVISKADYLLRSIFVDKYEPLRRHIFDAEEVAVKATEALDQINTERRTEITEEYVEKTLWHFKAVRTRIKNVNEFGLGVDQKTSIEVERRIRDLTWMKSIYSCPIICDTKYTSARRGVSDSHSEAYFSDEQRVSLSLLVQIYEKAPSHCRLENSNACSLEAEMSSSYNRIRTVQEQLSEWKERLHSFMPRTLRAISNRRDAQSRYSPDDVLEKYNIVSENELRNLQMHPLLRYVSIPEERNLTESLNGTMIMRDQLISIFAKDRCGHDVERIALPTNVSLIGKSGDFFLLRVVNHPLYFQLKKELAAIDLCASNLPVRTLEKVTYDWVLKVLHWIEKVAAAVFIPGQVYVGSPICKQCLSLADTERLTEEGQRIFFAITEESKKYLLKHRLSIVTRASTGNVTVKSCKGGKNLSIGGTVLKWIAFVYNGIRNDLASTLLWTKKVEGIISNDQISSGIPKSLLKMLQKAREHLAVAPNEQLLSDLLNKLKEYKHPVTQGEPASEKHNFIHNLLDIEAKEV